LKFDGLKSCGTRLTVFFQGFSNFFCDFLWVWKAEVLAELLGLDVSCRTEEGWCVVEEGKIACSAGTGKLLVLTARAAPGLARVSSAALSGPRRSHTVTLAKPPSAARNRNPWNVLSNSCPWSRFHVAFGGHAARHRHRRKRACLGIALLCVAATALASGLLHAAANHVPVRYTVSLWHRAAAPARSTNETRRKQTALYIIYGDDVHTMKKTK